MINKFLNFYCFFRYIFKNSFKLALLEFQTNWHVVAYNLEILMHTYTYTIPRNRKSKIDLSLRLMRKK